MTQRPVTTLAMVFGILAVLGVLMPWHAHIAEEPGQAARLVSCQRGYDSDFHGLVTLITAAVATVLTAWFVAKRTSPALSRGLLISAATLFAVGVVLTILDVSGPAPSRTFMHGTEQVTEGRAFGVFLTLGACAGAFLMTAVSVLSPKTPYRD